MKKASVIILTILILFSVSCKKSKEEIEKTPTENGESITLLEKEIGAKYTSDKLGFSIELTEYWYKYTKISEYKDYAVFSFSGETELAKDKPVLYIGKQKALEKLSLSDIQSIGGFYYVYNNEIDEIVDQAESSNRDIGNIQILKIEMDEVLSSLR